MPMNSPSPVRQNVMHIFYAIVIPDLNLLFTVFIASFKKFVIMQNNEDY